MNHPVNHPAHEAIITKMTVKQVLSQIDYIEILVAMGQMGQPALPIHKTLGYWFDDMRVHLQRLEEMTEPSVH